jgi:hypothetical protein
MDKPIFLFLPLVAFILAVAAVRFGYGAVVDSVNNQPAAFPTAQPFVSPICGPNNRNCNWEGFNFSGEPKPFKGLQFSEPPESLR